MAQTLTPEFSKVAKEQPVVMNLVILSTLKEQHTDSMGYTTYVFYIEELCDRNFYRTRYYSCTRFPNWEEKELNVGDRGYVELKINIAGKTEWFNGTEMEKYNYNSLQFIKFVGLNSTPKSFKTDEIKI